MDIPFSYYTGYSLGYSIIRKVDGKRYDFFSGVFAGAVYSGVAILTEGSGDYKGLYTASLPTPTGIFSDGDYLVYIHNRSLNNQIITNGSVYISNGSDATPPPTQASFPANMVVSGYLPGQDPRSQLFVNPANKLNVDSSGNVQSTATTIVGTGLVLIDMGQILPTGNQIVPNSIGDALALLRTTEYQAVIKNDKPSKNRVIYSS